MKFTKTPIAGAWQIDVAPIEDGRGFLARTFCVDEFSDLELETGIVQCSVSWNRVRGTLRGMHYQAAPHEETKIVRCTRGAIWDVIADLRPDSETRGQWTSVELTAENRRSLYIPRGVAHGFITLNDDSEVFYMMGTAFVAEARRGIAWDDPGLAIEWPIAPVVISEKDRSCPRWIP